MSAKTELHCWTAEQTVESSNPRATKLSLLNKTLIANQFDTRLFDLNYIVRLYVYEFPIDWLNKLYQLTPNTEWCQKQANKKHQVQ